MLTDFLCSTYTEIFLANCSYRESIRHQSHWCKALLLWIRLQELRSSDWRFQKWVSLKGLGKYDRYWLGSGLYCRPWRCSGIQSIRGQYLHPILTIYMYAILYIFHRIWLSSSWSWIILRSSILWSWNNIRRVRQKWRILGLKYRTRFLLLCCFGLIKEFAILLIYRILEVLPRIYNV